ncbi:hypothetical protein PV04_01861 [Phialophora macrospora]|uniref:Yeast cell wall synthesis Kre9/Knh1-like N-terminal domain-containing protein n=1 Tax=Phialophora macrospora TaxID=1851006 RepID=A0A0D2FYZ2_9EURO|nr:hypothetical protein PV04_01861 [Phialophora macrospora]
MPFFLRLLACSTAILAASFALKFSSPSSGSVIDPTQPISISWSVSYTDPSVFDLQLSNSDSNVDLTIATGVVTYGGTYTVPAGTLQSAGPGYTLVAVGNGITLGQVTGLSLGAVAEVTLVSTQTVIPTPAASTNMDETSATGTVVPTVSIDSVGFTTLSGTIIGSQVPISVTHTGSSFVTSTTSGTITSSSAATASAESTNTASGQKRLGSELVLGAAGILAGVVALLA